MSYIASTFEQARAFKWTVGEAANRLRGDGSKEPGFVGDPLAEAFEECCDLFNYLEEAERQTGSNFSVCRAQVRQIADRLQRRWQAANRPKVTASNSEGGDDDDI